MEKATLLRHQMYTRFGDSNLVEPCIWFTSIFTGVSLCELVDRLSIMISISCSKSYRALSHMEKKEWNNRSVSTAHAFWITTAAVYFLFLGDLFSDEAPYGPVVFRSTLSSEFVLGISMGYFIFDIVVLLRSYPYLGGAEYILHHSVGIISIALALHSGYAHLYVYMVLLSEATTPFINFRWYLATIGLRKSTFYTANGLLLFFTWMAVRILLFIYSFSHIYFHYDQVKKLHAAAFYVLFLGLPSLLIMNIIWFTKITYGMIKVLQKKDQGNERTGS